jgi:Cep192 domain 4/Abnormal spindle-like microcephaly-assoc'd, ASPM-SPD-2-Hydin
MHGPRSRFGVFVFAAVFVGMAGTVERAVAGGQEVTRQAESMATAQPIEATPASIRFENVPTGELYTQMVRLSNPANAPARITSITSSRPEFAISGVSLPVEIEPGANLNFTVAYKPKAASNIAACISVQTNLNATPLQLEVKASAAAKKLGLAADQMSLDFGVVAIGKKETRELELRNDGNTDVAISKITVNGANFNLVGDGAIHLAPGQKASVQVQFGPDGVGTWNGVISIVSNAQGSPLQIPVSGSGAAMSAHSVELKWEESLTQVAGYNIYRSGDTDGSYRKLEASPVSVASYADTGLAAGHTYSYLIKAVDMNNVESDDSEQISITVPEE